MLTTALTSQAMTGTTAMSNSKKSQRLVSLPWPVLPRECLQLWGC